MHDSAKKELSASLKKIMLTKSLNKITVTELSASCGLNRQTFYYHFKDVYNLVEWTFKEELKDALEGTDIGLDWQDGFVRVFDYAKHNRNFILNVVESIDRSIIEVNLYEEIYGLLIYYIKEREKTLGINVSPKDEKSISDFYKYPLVGFGFTWIKDGMKDNPEQSIRKIVEILNRNIDNELVVASKSSKI